MQYWSNRGTPLTHRGLDFLAIVAGTIAALPLAAIVVFAAHLIS